MIAANANCLRTYTITPAKLDRYETEVAPLIFAQVLTVDEMIGKIEQARLDKFPATSSVAAGAGREHAYNSEDSNQLVGMGGPPAMILHDALRELLASRFSW
jgi:hypothetical protein